MYCIGKLHVSTALTLGKDTNVHVKQEVVCASGPDCDI